MAKLQPMFITGANAKITVYDGSVVRTLAYATDVSYSINVDHIAVETMGRYEAVSNEPVNYSVGGNLSVVRYTKWAYNYAAAAAKLHGQAKTGNSVNNWAPGAFNPKVLLGSKTFDITIYQKLSSDTVDATTTALTTAPEKLIKIEDCRLTSRGAGLSKRNLMVEMFNFVGILASDEQDQTGYSGDDDLQP